MYGDTFFIWLNRINDNRLSLPYRQINNNNIMLNIIIGPYTMEHIRRGVPRKKTLFH